MKNFQEQLNNILNKYKSGELELSNEFTRADFLECARINIALQFLIENDLELQRPYEKVFLSDVINGQTDPVVMSSAQADILLAIIGIKNDANVYRTMVDENNQKDKKEKKEAISKLDDLSKKATLVAQEIMPDFLLNSYQVLHGTNASTKVYDEENYQIFDLDAFMKGVAKAGKVSPVFEVKTHGARQAKMSKQAEAKLRAITKENIEEFLTLVPSVYQATVSVGQQYWEGLKFSQAEETFVFNPQVREVRRKNRPQDKVGNLLPSYLDYFSETENRILTYEEFKNTPTYNVFKPFATEEEYNEFINSSEFLGHASYLENPVKFVSRLNYNTFATSNDLNKMEKQTWIFNKERDAEYKEWKNSMWTLETRESVDGRSEYRLPISDESDFYMPGEKMFITAGYFAKEEIVLPAKYYHKAKRISKNNPTVQVKKLQNEKALNIARKIGAGVLALSILVNATGFAVKEGIEDAKDLVESIKDALNKEQPSTPESPEQPEQTGPSTQQPEEPQTPETNNTEVKDTEEEIRDNPAEELEPPVDNVDQNGDVQPSLPPVEEETTPPAEEEITPPVEEETTPPVEEETDSKPEYDQPDAPVQDENDIQGDRENESDDDEFFFD